MLLVGVYMAGAYQGGQATQQAINDAKTAINSPRPINAKTAINSPRPINAKSAINTATGLMTGP